jgi:hypothetical protein
MWIHSAQRDRYEVSALRCPQLWFGLATLFSLAAAYFIWMRRRRVKQRPSEPAYLPMFTSSQGPPPVPGMPTGTPYSGLPITPTWISAHVGPPAILPLAVPASAMAEPARECTLESTVPLFALEPSSASDDVRDKPDYVKGALKCSHGQSQDLGSEVQWGLVELQDGNHDLWA